jgi:membrane associated rhomboid family serine protease
MTNGLETPLRITHDDRLAQDWELVLLAQGLSPRVRRTRDGIILTVPEEEAETALAGLSAYDRENPPKLQERDEPIGSASLVAGIGIAGMLLAFFTVTVLANASVPWFERGSANADRILVGELWRTVTALTLHGDLVHAVSNAVAMALFLGAASGVLGVGLASALVLLAGAGGNLANAFLQTSPHVSVGASTAVFGAVGILGSHAMVRHRWRAVRRRGAWVPIAAALALLAMLGTGGARVDVWAHLLGFLLGGGLGILIAFVALHRPGPAVQWICGSAALAVIIYCWTLALR